MSEVKKNKRVALKGCVIDGKNVLPGDEVKISNNDAKYCDGAQLTADPSTDSGKELIASMPKAEKKKK